MSDQFIPILSTFALYIVIIFLIAYIASRATHNLSDYILGGRHLSAPIAALGAGASDMSGWLMLALPGAVFTSGLNQIWLPIGLTLGAYCNWKFIAKRLRVYTEVAENSQTIPAYFDNRFHDTSRILRIITSIVIVIFFTFYTSAGFVSGGLLTETTFSMNYHTALLISSAVIIIYTFIGGFLAVSWIDFFQGTLMFLALLIVPFVTANQFGTWHEVFNFIQQQHPNALNMFNEVTPIMVISLLGWGLGYFGQPHILVRFMAIQSPRDIPIARGICMSWMVLALIGAFLTGLTGIAYFNNTTLKETEAVFLVLAEKLFNPWLTGFLLAAVLSAIMSTIAAQLLAAASALSEDFYHTLFRKKASPKELIWVTRIALFAIAIIAILLALDHDNKILSLVAYAWSGFGASFGPVILLSLYWSRMTRNAAFAGMFVGAGTVLIWPFLESTYGGFFKIYDIVPGFILSTLTIIIVTLFDKPPPQSVINEFNKVKKSL